MPTRMIREGLLDSEAIFRAGERAEVLFMRLMLVADDFGRYDGRVSVICRRCWPLGGPAETDITARLDSLVECGLVQRYEHEGKPFIFIPKFHQRLRLKNKSKWPDPPSCPQVAVTGPTNDGHVPDERRPEVEVEVEGSIKQRHSVGDGIARAGDLGAAALRNLQPGASPAHRIAGGDETPAALLAAVMHENGLRGNAFHPLIVEWARERVTVERLKAAIAKARQRPGKERGAFGPEYLDPILHDESKPAAQMTQERVAEDAAKRIAATDATLHQQREDAARASGPPGGSIAAFVAGALGKAAPT